MITWSVIGVACYLMALVLANLVFRYVSFSQYPCMVKDYKSCLIQNDLWPLLSSKSGPHNRWYGNTKTVHTHTKTKLASAVLWMLAFPAESSPNCLYIQFSSVQFKMVSMCLGKPLCAPPPSLRSFSSVALETVPV